MKQIALINPENVSESEALNYRLREAARAIIFDEQNQIALLHATNNNYYKLPGGGIESEEDHLQALKRECREEIGCEIEDIEELGFVVEYRKKYELKQISYCYIAKLKGEKGTPDLTESEIAEGFETVWVPYEEAKKLISESKPTVYEGMYMVPRDAAILQAFADQKYIVWAKLELGEISEYSREAHGDQSSTYRIVAQTGNYFLKIAPELDGERQRLLWLAGQLPVPKVIGFTSMDGKDALLLSALPGENLAVRVKSWSPEKVARKLALALCRFHTSPPDNCPFGALEQGKVLVHGDACLPNFIFQDDTFSGYIDVGEARIDYPEVDLSAAIWSLQRNFVEGQGANFLKEYEYPNPTEEVAEKLRLQYEEIRRN